MTPPHEYAFHLLLDGAEFDFDPQVFCIQRLHFTPANFTLRLIHPSRTTHSLVERPDTRVADCPYMATAY
jgi:hypothetical protein